jgi:hypothetical protein
MKTQVEFRSDKFPPYDGEEEEINPGLWGKRLAEYFQKSLPHHGLKVTGISPEDWGWMVELENDEFRYGSDVVIRMAIMMSSYALLNHQSHSSESGSRKLIQLYRSVASQKL